MKCTILESLWRRFYPYLLRSECVTVTGVVLADGNKREILLVYLIQIGQMKIPGMSLDLDGSPTHNL